MNTAKWLNVLLLLTAFSIIIVKVVNNQEFSSAGLTLASFFIIVNIIGLFRKDKHQH
ncbi:hypothetical protein JOC77_000163 [Peribacillus deserti]|uniref:Uncharacterized protein n=1 Tax=Peribacillus deserti TaxID=673318 RepID=A0ABS2QCP1_9BACI|nr:hypothetical protein [Peribacillus deserti]MBM7690760.1 hypothetical protein [Peribacillus deserti]